MDLLYLVTALLHSPYHLARAQRAWLDGEPLEGGQSEINTRRENFDKSGYYPSNTERR